MRERQDPTGAVRGPNREDGIPVLTEVEERRSGVAGPGARGAAALPADTAPTPADTAPTPADTAPTPADIAAAAADTAPTARIDGGAHRIAALIAELASLRAATARMSARLAALEETSREGTARTATTREERAIPVLATAVWMLERTDYGEPRSAVLGARTQIGRAADCDIVVDGVAVSRHHALIQLDRGGAVLEDLNSTNGSFVNGHRVRRVRLRDGDVVTLGDARFRVAGPDDPDAPVP